MNRKRALARSKARYMLMKDGYHIFGLYTTCDAKVRDGRSKKFVIRETRKSFFSKAWRDYAN